MNSFPNKMPECDRFIGFTLFCGLSVVCGNGFMLIGFKACVFRFKSEFWVRRKVILELGSL